MGHRIELGEIEAIALKQGGIRRVCCVYDANAKRIVLFYVGDAEGQALSAHLSALLPRYMLPNLLVPLENLPLTDNGKIDRRGLRERAAQLN